MDMPRNPWIAVLINIICPGLGYIYAGERMWFGILFIVADVSYIIWRVTEHISWSLSVPLVVSWLAIWLATTIDVYFLMRDSHKTSKPKPKDEV